MADRADVGISDGTRTPSLFADCRNPPTVQSALPSAASRATLRSQSCNLLKLCEMMHNLTGARAQALEKCMRIVRNYIIICCLAQK